MKDRSAEAGGAGRRRGLAAFGFPMAVLTPADVVAGNKLRAPGCDVRGAEPPTFTGQYHSRDDDGTLADRGRDMKTFEHFAREVNALCVKRLRCTWADLAGDRQPLEISFNDGWTPLQCVQWWAEKHGLEWVDDKARPTPTR